MGSSTSRLLAAAAVLVAAALSSGAQPAVQAPRTVDGRIVRPAAGPADPAPIAGVVVTLHRVGRDTAGPLDSLRTDASGRYRFRYRPFGSGDAIYFVSASYSGIAYFSAPLAKPRVDGDEAEITVFDTTSGPVPLTVRGRHVVVTNGVGGASRDVTEIYELSNDSSMTVVAGGGSDHPAWSASLPAGARAFEAQQGDVGADAMRMSAGRAAVDAPFPPGLKQLSFRYTLPSSAFPLSIPLERATSVLEVLVEDPTATVEAGKLAPTSPVALGGRSFRRWLGQDVPAGTVLRVAFVAAPADGRRLYVVALLALVGATMLGTLARAAGRRRGAGVRDDDPQRRAERLAREIADLDRRWARVSTPAPAAAAEHSAERERLKRELTDALAARDGLR